MKLSAPPQSKPAFGAPSAKPHMPRLAACPQPPTGALQSPHAAGVCRVLRWLPKAWGIGVGGDTSRLKMCISYKLRLIKIY